MQQIFVNAEPDLELSLYYIFVINGHSGCYERSICNVFASQLPKQLHPDNSSLLTTSYRGFEEKTKNQLIKEMLCLHMFYCTITIILHTFLIKIIV